MNRIRPKLTYANVVASLALFIALGGSAYAIGTGAIGSREIRDNSIRSRDVRTNSLSGRDINERSIRGAVRIYVRSSSRSIVLGQAPGLTQQSVGCNAGDSAVSGSFTVTGDELSYHGNGHLTDLNSRGAATAYVAGVTGEPSAAGQRRTLSVSVVCIARARR